MIKNFSKCKWCNKVKSREQHATHGIKKYLRGICKECLWNKKGKPQLRSLWTYRNSKKSYCEMCGFVGLPCQLDVNHKDYNHKNDSLDNLETLCANCHRLVTFMQQKK